MISMAIDTQVTQCYIPHIACIRHLRSMCRIYTIPVARITLAVPSYPPANHQHPRPHLSTEETPVSAARIEWQPDTRERVEDAREHASALGHALQGYYEPVYVNGVLSGHVFEYTCICNPAYRSTPLLNERPKREKRMRYSITTYRNEHNAWHAKVLTSWRLSSDSEDPKFNVDTYLEGMQKAARQAIIQTITDATPNANHDYLDTLQVALTSVIDPLGNDYGDEHSGFIDGAIFAEC